MSDYEYTLLTLVVINAGWTTVAVARDFSSLDTRGKVTAVFFLAVTMAVSFLFTYLIAIF